MMLYRVLFLLFLSKDRTIFSVWIYSDKDRSSVSCVSQNSITSRFKVNITNL